MTTTPNAPARVNASAIEVDQHVTVWAFPKPGTWAYAANAGNHQGTVKKIVPVPVTETMSVLHITFTDGRTVEAVDTAVTLIHPEPEDDTPHPLVAAAQIVGDLPEAAGIDTDDVVVDVDARVPDVHVCIIELPMEVLEAPQVIVTATWETLALKVAAALDKFTKDAVLDGGGEELALREYLAENPYPEPTGNEVPDSAAAHAWVMGARDVYAGWYPTFSVEPLHL